MQARNILVVGGRGFDVNPGVGYASTHEEENGPDFDFRVLYIVG